MEFTSCRSINGQQVIVYAAWIVTELLIVSFKISFAFHDRQLVVQASRSAADGVIETLEVIPNSFFVGDLSFPLAHHYVHWLNLRTKLIEFRPLNDVWCTNDGNFELDVQSWKLSQGKNSGILTVDIHSSMFKMLSTRLEPLEEAKYMIVTYHPNLTTKIVGVDLPRSHVGFFLNEEQQLESVNARGYIVDDIQAAGTMFGLRNQLILRKKALHAERTPGSRLLMIPFGTVVSKCTNHHISVHIDTKSSTSVEYHTYVIDDILGRLSCGSGMKSWFYMLYLHAVTSHCLPDPLLNRTGTEEALLALRSARSFSFIDFSIDVMEQLGKIAALTPVRKFYPPHLQTMQSTFWDPSLHPLNQHNAFAFLVTKIFAHMKVLQCFHGCTLMDDLEPPSSSEHLTIRVMSRGSSYYCQDLLDITSLSCRDTSYGHLVNGLHTVERNTLLAAYRISRFSRENLTTIAYFPSSVWDTFSLWSQSRTLSANDPPESRSMLQTLSYHRGWLADDLEGYWMEIHNLCCMVDFADSRWRYQVPFTFSAMAYARPSMEQAAFMYMALIANVVMHAFNPSRPLLVRISGAYTVSDGHEPSEHALRRRLQSEKRQLELTPSYRLIRERSESSKSFTKRKKNHWNQGTDRAVDQLVDYLIDQWPRLDLLQQPGEGVGDWIDIVSSIQKAEDYFSSCSRNTQLRSYVKSLETVLSSRHPILNIPQEDDGTDFINHLYSGLVESFTEDYQRSLSPPTLHHLLASSSPASLPRSSTLRFGSELQTSAGLEAMLTRLENSHRRSSIICKLYVDDLRESRQVLEGDDGRRSGKMESRSLLWYEETSARQCEVVLSAIRDATSPPSIYGRVLFEAGQWPNIYPRIMLQQLNIHARPAMSSSAHHSDWYEPLVYFAERILEHQRSRRLLDHHIYGKTDEFATEMKNDRFNREEALREPDWLLVQVCSYNLPSYFTHLSPFRLKEISS